MANRWSEAEAREVLRVWKESGLSGERFAAAQGLVPQRLYRWRSKLEGAGKAAEKIGELALLPVHVRATRREGEPVTILLRTGQVVKVGRGFDEEAFARAVTILEGA